MELWKPSYLKEGPGIEKDAPPKTGLALFFEILVREFWQVLKLNLLFVACVLPLATFGPARAALSRCTMNMVRDLPNDVWYDFRKAIRCDFQRNFFMGILELFCFGMLALCCLLPAVRQNIIVFGVLALAALLFGLFFGYFWPIAVTVELPLAITIKNATALSLACLPHSLPALILNALLLGIGWWMFPLSLPLVLFIPFGISSFITSFAAWGDIKRFILKSK